jgi:hypothetical protein
MVFRDSPCPRGERHGALTESATGTTAPRKPKRTIDAAAAPALDRSKVERLIARLDGAMAKRDAKAVLALLAQEAVVEVPAGGAGTALDKSGYADYLNRVFGASGYVYRAAPARTSVSKNKPRASVTRKTRETAWVNGRVAVVEMKERLTVESQGRGLRILALRKEMQAPAGRAGGGA